MKCMTTTLEEAIVRAQTNADASSEVEARASKLWQYGQSTAGQCGLVIKNATWQKHRDLLASGDNPSDMTLEHCGVVLPLIRSPMFEYNWWEVAIDQLELVCGNENPGEPRYKVPLRDYLSHFRAYLSDPDCWKGDRNSLLAASETSVIMNAQACYAPVADDTIEFNVRFYNQKCSTRNPAVLVIVATENGTSAQVVEEGTQKLYFNDGGLKSSFIARARHNIAGEHIDGGDHTAEKATNVAMIIQVPLKHRIPSPPNRGRNDYPALPGFPSPQAPPAFVYGGTLQPQGAGVLHPVQQQHDQPLPPPPPPPAYMSEMAELPPTLSESSDVSSYAHYYFHVPGSNHYPPYYMSQMPSTSGYAYKAPPSNMSEMAEVPSTMPRGCPYPTPPSYPPPPSTMSEMAEVPSTMPGCPYPTPPSYPPPPSAMSEMAEVPSRMPGYPAAPSFPNAPSTMSEMALVPPQEAAISQAPTSFAPPGTRRDESAYRSGRIQPQYPPGMPPPPRPACLGAPYRHSLTSHDAEPRFSEINGLAIERDEQNPIRVTLQFYRAHDSVAPDMAMMKEIAAQIDRAMSHGDYFGSRRMPA